MAFYIIVSMKEIKEVLVVEGKNDTKKLKSFFVVDTIETGGSHLGKKTIELIRRVNEKRGVILLLDPDSPGENVRKRINEAIPGLKNAFLLKKDARTTKKVGVEHADKEVLENALSQLVTYGQNKETLTYEDFLKLSLNGSQDAQKRRNIISAHFAIGECNAKTMFKRLNYLGLDYQTLLNVLEEENND